jgi:hypothetical protein
MATIQRITYKYVSEIFQKPVEKNQVPFDLIRITKTLYEDLFVFVIVSSWIPRRMRNISDNVCTENQILISSIMWKFMAQTGGPQNIIKCGTCVLHAEWVKLQTQAYNKSYLLLCTAIIDTRQTVMFSCTHTASLVYFLNQFRCIWQYEYRSYDR